MATSEELGRAAYEAYARSVDFKSVHDDDLWAWDELPARIAAAWACAAAAVRGRVIAEERAANRPTATRESETDK